MVKLVDIVFPELNQIFKSIHTKSIYALLSKYQSAKTIAGQDMETIITLLGETSRGRMRCEKRELLYNEAKNSIGSPTSATELEIKQTLATLDLFDEQVKEIDDKIKEVYKSTDTHLESIPGIGINNAAIIISEIGDFNNFSSADKIQAFAGLSPSTYQSGLLDNSRSHMEKRGCKFLSYAILSAARCVASWDENFSLYMQKKLDEGKHYFVALSHVAKKLIRVMYALETHDCDYAI